MYAFIAFLAAFLVPIVAFAADPVVAVPPSDFDTSQIAALLAAHKWVPASMIVINLLIRLQKADKLPGFGWVKPNYRWAIALFLGIVSGVLDKVAVDSKTWLVAVLDGVLSGVLAIALHDAVIEGFRNGKEILGGGAKNPAPTATPAGGPDALASKPQPPSGSGTGLSIILLGFITSIVPNIEACGYGATACKVISVVNDNCAVLEYLADDGTVQRQTITKDDAKEIGRQLAAKHAAAPDGGAK